MTVSLTYSGPYFFAQVAGGLNYRPPVSTSTSATVSRAPPSPGIIALSEGGTKTITLSQPVVDPVFALVGWKAQSNVTFGTEIVLEKAGPGPSRPE